MAYMEAPTGRQGKEDPAEIVAAGSTPLAEHNRPLMGAVLSSARLQNALARQLLARSSKAKAAKALTGGRAAAASKCHLSLTKTGRLARCHCYEPGSNGAKPCLAVDPLLRILESATNGEACAATQAQKRLCCECNTSRGAGPSGWACVADLTIACCAALRRCCVASEATLLMSHEGDRIGASRCGRQLLRRIAEVHVTLLLAAVHRLEE